MHQDSLGVSIVICCYNSAERLPKTLEHLANQRLSAEINMEIVLVDNNSTDKSKEVASNVWKLLGRKEYILRIVDQPVPGLSAARAMGAKCATYQHIIFCDDDNWLADDYVQASYDLLETDWMIGAACGTGIAVSDVPFPKWFEKYAGGYAVGRPAQHSCDITDRRCLTGAGLVTRKSLFEAAFAEFPAILSDRKGSSLMSGGDSEYTMRLVLMGYRLYFLEQLSFKHFIPNTRLTEKYRDSLFAGFRAAAPVLELYMFYIDLRGKHLSQKTGLMFGCLVRLLVCLIRPIRGWKLGREIQLFYHLTGVALGNIQEEGKLIRQFYKRGNVIR